MPPDSILYYQRQQSSSKAGNGVKGMGYIYVPKLSEWVLERNKTFNVIQALDISAGCMVYKTALCHIHNTEVCMDFLMST